MDMRLRWIYIQRKHNTQHIHTHTFGTTIDTISKLQIEFRFNHCTDSLQRRLIFQSVVVIVLHLRFFFHFSSASDIADRANDTEIKATKCYVIIRAISKFKLA